MKKVLGASLPQLRASVWTGLVAICVVGWLLVSGHGTGRAEETQTPSGGPEKVASSDAAAGQDSSNSAMPIPEGSLISVHDLAEALSSPTAKRPQVFHVGYHVLFRGGHIAGSRYIGPASKPEGLQALREAVRKLPRKQAVVLYCGCCPWTDCPNVRPAYAAVESTGRAVKILYIAKNLQKDWIDAGLPTGSGDQ